MRINHDQIAAAGRFAWLSRAPIALAALMWGLSGSAMASAAAPTAAQSCANEQLRIDEPFGPALSDCRAYEQVSPAEKNLADALGAITTVRVSPGGESVAYDSLGPFPLAGGAQEGSSQLFSTYLSARAGEAWTTTKLDPQVSPGGSAQPLALSEDLRYTFERSDDQPPLTPQGIEGREAVYLRENATGSERLLFQSPAGETASFFLVADADEDSRVFFESSNDLSEEAAPGTRNLYEWHEGTLSLVDLLPGESAPTGGAGAGQRGPGALQESVELPDHSFGSVSYFTQNAVSQDGSEIYFTDLATGLLYVRHQSPGGEGETLGLSAKPAAWQAATADGSLALYIQEGVLYRYTGAASTALTPTGGEALGVLGISADGSYIYFAASGVLAAGAVAGDQNIYLWHEGAITLVSSGGEEADWSSHTLLHASTEASGPEEGAKSARVSADGRTLMFTSRAQLTPYENHGKEAACGEALVEAPCNEIYLYEAGEGALTCVSCNPAGTPATHDALLYHLVNDGIIAPSALYPDNLPRNLSADGSRLFFQTEEALLPAATNGQMNVYEWERTGSGSCPAQRGPGGCLYLISTGVSEEPSYFAEASSDGNDVFLFTRQPLVAQDEDALMDVYDARVDGGIAAQNYLPSASECSQEACHPPAPPASEVGPPVSQTFDGGLNLVPQTQSSSKSAVTKPKKAVKHKQTAKRKRKRKHSGHGKSAKGAAQRARTRQADQSTTTRSPRQ